MAVSSVDVVRCVRSHPGITQADLGENFGLSARTIRAHIQRANNEMRGFAAIETRDGGYELAVTNDSQFESWSGEHAGFINGAIPATQADRVSYLLHDLLERTNWITLEDLSQVLFISKSRLSRCMKQVEQTLAHFNLTLEKRPHYGMRVVGSEMDRRLCLASLAIEALSAHGGIFATDEDVDAPAAGEEKAASIAPGVRAMLADLTSTRAGVANHELLDIIVRCVNESAEEADFHINSAAYQNLIVHIAIALIRIEEGCYVPMEPERMDAIRESDGYQVACAIARRVREQVSIELPEEEIGYIAIHLASKQTLPLPSATGEDGEDNLVISDEVWNVVIEALEAVWNAFRFDFRGDLELRMNLARHIVPLAVRLKFNMSLKNPLLADVRMRFPLAYSMAIEASAVLARHYGAELSEDEIGYIAFAFALALERQKTGAPKKNILVVCASGAGSARLLEYRCRQEFGNLVDTIKTCDVLGLDRIDVHEFDYVFTTVPIPKKLPVPVLEVKYFLDSSEAMHAKELLRGDDVQLTSLAQIDRALFFPHLDLASKQEVLDFLLDRAQEEFPVASNFRELVWKREAMMATTLGNSVAMPHPMEPASGETRICAAVLERPIVWDSSDHMVQVVFLMAVAKGAADSHRDLLSALASLFFSKEAIEDLIANPTKDNLHRLVEKNLEADGVS